MSFHCRCEKYAYFEDKEILQYLALFSPLLPPPPHPLHLFIWQQCNGYNFTVLKNLHSLALLDSTVKVCVNHSKWKCVVFVIKEHEYGENLKKDSCKISINRWLILSADSMGQRTLFLRSMTLITSIYIECITQTGQLAPQILTVFMLHTSHVPEHLPQYRLAVYHCISSSLMQMSGFLLKCLATYLNHFL